MTGVSAKTVLTRGRRHCTAGAGGVALSGPIGWTMFSTDLVARFLDGDHLLLDECVSHPRLVWTAILRLLTRRLSDADLAFLAAGPLETLLARHGPEFIDIVEGKARRDGRFRHLLGGVWRNAMTDDVWRRVQAARDEVW